MKTNATLAVATLATLATFATIGLPALANAEPAKKDAPTEDRTVRHPLWTAELQVGYGISKQTSGDMTHSATGPLSFAALGAVAINDDPFAYAIGGLVGETLERNAIGVTAGTRLLVPNTPVRLTGTGVWMVAPKTLWGATGSAGACWGAGSLGLCGDVQVTAYVAGTALPKDELALQFAFVLSVVARGGN